jgi:hypothetical protein
MSTDERTAVPARRRYRAALSLPADPSDEELARDWTLSAADKVEIQGCRGDDNRLRFALQLCVLHSAPATCCSLQGHATLAASVPTCTPDDWGTPPADTAGVQ